MENQELQTNKTKRTDISISIDPRNIIVEEGFNSRFDFGDIEKLAYQIKQAGLKNPIHVQIVKQPDGTEKYKLIDGERRYRAIMSLIEQGEDVPYIKAVVVPSNTSKVDLYVEQAMCNEGKQFNEYEWGVLARKLRDECGKNVSEIAKLLGIKNSGQVTYYLQVLEMPEDFQELIRTNKLCGPDVRRILQANGRDYDKARVDIQKLFEKSAEKGEQKLKLRNLGFDSQTKLFKDSKTLLKGLNVLFDYVRHYQEEGKSMEMDLSEMHEALKSGKLINTIFESAAGNETDNEHPRETA